MSDNPYLDAVRSMSPEQLSELVNRVLGPYKAEQLEEHVANQLWHKQLCYMVPIDTANSLHVFEEIYEFNGQRYSCYWELGEDGDGPPFMIERMTLR